MSKKFRRINEVLLTQLNLFRRRVTVLSVSPPGMVIKRGGLGELLPLCRRRSFQRWRCSQTRRRGCAAGSLILGATLLLLPCLRLGLSFPLKPRIVGGLLRSCGGYLCRYHWASMASPMTWPSPALFGVFGYCPWLLPVRTTRIVPFLHMSFATRLHLGVKLLTLVSIMSVTQNDRKVDLCVVAVE